VPGRCSGASVAPEPSPPGAGPLRFLGAWLRKLEPRPDPTTVQREVERLMLAFPVLPLTGPVVLEALRGVREHLLSHYEAQIWAVARLGQVAVVLSEDFNPGAVLDGVSFTNPLDPAFDLAALG
jgi:predicted nucleic acid-binding protein